MSTVARIFAPQVSSVCTTAALPSTELWSAFCKKSPSSTECKCLDTSTMQAQHTRPQSSFPNNHPISYPQTGVGGSYQQTHSFPVLPLRQLYRRVVVHATKANFRLITKCATSQDSAGLFYPNFTQSSSRSRNARNKQEAMILAERHCVAIKERYPTRSFRSQ
jgi:hypothetical protein